MYKIGEFSKKTNLSVKTLRYYDEEKILKKKIFQQEELLKKFNLYTEYNLMEECHMDYKVEIKSMPEIMIASSRYKGEIYDAL